MKSRRNRTPCVRPSGEHGFTLIELLAGIAISSLLLVALFQLLSDLTAIRETYRQQSLRTHTQVALRRILYQDLYSLPVNKTKFRGTPRELYRNTVAYSPTEGLRMETRVHYFTRRGEGTLNLIREWKWVDLHDDYEGSSVLLRANKIRLQYVTESGQTINRTSGTNEKIAGVELVTDDMSMTVPVGTREEDSSEETAGESSAPAVGR